MKIKKIFIKCVNWILASFISTLGFAGCWEFGKAEYGSPSATYTVKGTVVNEAAGGPITGIRVGYSPEVWDEDVYGPSPAYQRSGAYVITNANGGFTLKSNFSGWGSKSRTIPVYVEDIDGEENGLFQPKMAEVNFSNSVHSGKTGNWYGGEYTITTTIQLTEIEID